MKLKLKSPVRVRVSGPMLAPTAVLITVALVFSACSTSGKKSASCPVDALAKAASDGPVEITFWHPMRAQLGESLEKLTARFNEEQDEVEVNLVAQATYTEILTKFRAGLPSGKSLPDLLIAEDTSTRLLLDSGAVLPAQACIDAEKYDTSDHLPRVLDYYSVDDALGPMPFNTSNPLLYFNKVAFENAGLDPNDPPSTLEEVRDASEKIVASGAADYGIAWHIEAGDIEQWLAKAGEPFANHSNGRDGRADEITLDSKVGTELFTWLDEMADDKLLLNSGRTDSGIDHMLAVGTGKAAMTIQTSAALSTSYALLGEGKFPGVALGVGPMPGPSGGGVAVGGGALWMVNKGSDAAQAATWEFAKWLNEPGQQAEWHAGSGYLPLRKSSVDLAVVTDLWASQPSYRLAYDQLAASPELAVTGGAVLGDYAGLRIEIEKTLEEMFQGKFDGATAAKKATDRANEVLRAYEDRIGG